ncbi:hypothetical protein R3P38DRAFT_3172005 [Favolaschia claudopus]|uniref:Uncharacterized protein n=1 Tax=Favolaschia claudopus TaxID=2862362 RepID=A0AAW0DJ74_9AGAR
MQLFHVQYPAFLSTPDSTSPSSSQSRSLPAHDPMTNSTIYVLVSTFNNSSIAKEDPYPPFNCSTVLGSSFKDRTLCVRRELSSDDYLAPRLLDYLKVSSSSPSIDSGKSQPSLDTELTLEMHIATTKFGELSQLISFPIDSDSLRSKLAPQVHFGIALKQLSISWEWVNWFAHARADLTLQSRAWFINSDFSSPDDPPSKFYPAAGNAIHLCNRSFTSQVPDEPNRSAHPLLSSGRFDLLRFVPHHFARRQTEQRGMPESIYDPRVGGEHIIKRWI